MKFLIITRANYPTSSWGNRVMLIAKGLINNGIDVKILVTYPWPTKENIEASDNFVEYLTVPRTKKENILSIFYQINTLKQLKNKLKYFTEIDSVLLTGDRWIDSLIVSHYCKKVKAKFYVEVVDEIGRNFGLKKKNALYNFLALMNRKMFNNYLYNVDKIFVISSFLERKYKLITNPNKVVRSSPTLIDINHYYSRLKIYKYFTLQNDTINRNGLIITYAGSCMRPNGLLFFLDAAKRLLLKNNYNLKIIFVLHLGDIEFIEKYISKIGITENVEIIPGINPNFIPSIYELSDILVLPEQGDTIANAGFPGKTGEYLISGKAIIATNFSDLKLYLKHGYNCMISEIGDLDTYTNNLEELIINKEKLIQLGRNAKLTGNKYFNYIEASKIYIQ